MLGGGTCRVKTLSVAAGGDTGLRSRSLLGQPSQRLPRLGDGRLELGIRLVPDRSNVASYTLSCPIAFRLSMGVVPSLARNPASVILSFSASATRQRT